MTTSDERVDSEIVACDECLKEVPNSEATAPELVAFLRNQRITPPSRLAILAAHYFD